MAVPSPGKFQFAIDRGGTFTDIFARCPGGRVRVMKLLSEDPANYRDAPTEGIRRILQEVRGRARGGRGEPFTALGWSWLGAGTAPRGSGDGGAQPPAWQLHALAQAPGAWWGADAALEHPSGPVRSPRSLWLLSPPRPRPAQRTAQARNAPQQVGAGAV